MSNPYAPKESAATLQEETEILVGDAMSLVAYGTLNLSAESKALTQSNFRNYLHAVHPLSSSIIQLTVSKSKSASILAA